MKRKELIKRISSAGCELERHGARHALDRNQKTGKKQSVPRHDEIDEKREIKELS